MESNKNLIWIIVIIIAVLVVTCCCIISIIAVGIGVLAPLPVYRSIERGWVQERSEQTFDVSDSPVLEIDNFAGKVTVQAGPEGVISVSVTKRATSMSNLNKIDVDIQEQDGGLVIETHQPRLITNAAVHLDITTPPDTILDLKNEAGNVEVRDLKNNVNVNVGAGNVVIQDVVGETIVENMAGTIDISGADGHVDLVSGVGAITYQGYPRGESRFESEIGAILIMLPRNPDLKIDLKLDIGEIDVDCDIEGLVSRREVKGIIGTGDQGLIYARGALGGIGLVCK
jgi:hypothetical protein